MRTDQQPALWDEPTALWYDLSTDPTGGYPGAVGARQRAYLRRLLRQYFPDRRPVQYDLDGGTGRGARMLRGLVRHAYGCDASTAPVPERGPTLVTVLRSAPDTGMRPEYERAFAFAARVLAPGDGLLVVESHDPPAGRWQRGRHRRGRAPGAVLSHVDTEALLRRYGFTVLERCGSAIFPERAYRQPLLRPLVRRLDDLLCRPGWLARCAIDVLHVAHRAPAQIRPPSQVLENT
jgi:hypothetical protein